MRLQTMKRPVISLLILFFALGGCASLSSTEEQGEEGESITFDRVIELEKPIHFLGPTQEDVVIPSGTYYVKAHEGNLRLMADESPDTREYTVEADATSHKESIQVPEPIWSTEESEEDEEDKGRKILMLLLPGGEAWEAVGSTSGIQSRGMRFSRAKVRKRRPLTKIPRVRGIFTAPRFGSISPYGKIIIRGKSFGSSKGRIKLYLSQPIKKQVYLKIKQWSDTRITATVPGPLVGLQDHWAKFQIRSSKGHKGNAWKVLYYATRQLNYIGKDDPAINLLSCGAGGDINICNGVRVMDGTPGCATAGMPKYESLGIYGQHANCQPMVDYDDGKDRYQVTLKNGWVFHDIQRHYKKMGGDVTVDMPSSKALKRSVIGKSSWTPTIKWKVGPGIERILYGYKIRIEGPKGIPHY